MSIDLSKYKKSKKTNALPKFETTSIGDRPARIQNLSQFNDKDLYYTYYTFDKGVSGYVERKEAHDSSDGKKKFIPYSLTVDGKWVMQAWPKNRTLYNEYLLKSHPDKPVAIHEGEKAADYGQKHLTKYNNITFQGGSKAAGLSNYEHLKDKDVTLFPDNDEDGIRAMAHVAKILIEKEITFNIKIVDVTDLPDKFDVADAPYHKEISIDGLMEKADEFDPDKYSKQWKEVQKSEDKKSVETKMEKFLKAYIYIRSVMSFWELDSKELLKKEQLNDWNLADMKGESLTTALLKHKDFENNKVHSVFTHAGMAPGIINIKQGQFEAINKGIYYNTYYPSNIVPEPGDVSEILDYYKWLLGDENWKWVEMYIAYMIQHPGKKVRWAPVITSVEGGGKGLLATLVSALLGHHNCNTQLMYDQMVNQFSNILMGLQFGIINELDLSSRKNIKALTNALKKFITDDTLTIELKGRPQIKIPFFCNFMLFSNDEDCLHLTKFARRYLFCKVKRTQDEINEKLDAGVKDKILDALEFGSKELGHLLHYFKNIKIEDPKVFQRNAPKTDDFYEVVEKSRPMIHRVLDERLENNQWPFQFDGDWGSERKEYKTNKETGSQYVSGSRYYTKLCFSGMVVAADLYEVLLQDPIMKREFLTRDLIVDWCVEHHILWPNGNPTKQIKLPINTHPRAYLIKDFEIGTAVDIEMMKPKPITHFSSPTSPLTIPKKLSNCSEGELGDHYYFHTYDSVEYNNPGLGYVRSENLKTSPNYKEDASEKPTINL